MKRYEGMFLFDNSAARDWPTIEQEVRRLLGRIGGELLACVKFDERKLAYEIRRRRRGTYALTYFQAPPDRIADLERDARLSELILRLLVLRADHVSDERINELRARPADVPLQPLSGDGRRHDEHRAARAADAGRSGRSDEAPEAAEPLEESAAVESEAEAPEGGVGAADAVPDSPLTDD